MLIRISALEMRIWSLCSFLYFFFVNANKKRHWLNVGGPASQTRWPPHNWTAAFFVQCETSSRASWYTLNFLRRWAMVGIRTAAPLNNKAIAEHTYTLHPRFALRRSTTTKWTSEVSLLHWWPRWERELSGPPEERRIRRHLELLFKVLHHQYAKLWYMP